MVFDYREHDLRCGGLLLRVMVSLVVSRLVSWSVFGLRRTCSCPDTADGSMDTALVLVDTSLVS